VRPAAFRALGNPRRRHILRLVWDAELSAGQIAAHFDISWPAVSQNLRVLRDAGLLVERKSGNWRLYRADQAALGPLASVIRDMWQADMELLGALAENEQLEAEADHDHQ
jgi:DNA-binding transcriptional ArsR family regulator